MPKKFGSFQLIGFMIIYKKMEEIVNNIERIKVAGRLLLIICSIIEMLFFPSLENFAWCILFLYSWFLFEKFIFKYENLKKYFLPTLAISGSILMYVVLPLVVTLIEAKPVTFNFEVPLDLCLYQFINITVIVAAYLLCISLYNPDNFFVNLWSKLGLFTPVSDAQIWFFSCICLLFFVISALTHSEASGGIEAVNASANGGGFVAIFESLLQGCLLMPICLFFKNFYGGCFVNDKKQIVPFMLFMLVVIVCSIITTRRKFIFEIGLAIALLYCLNSILYTNKQLITLKNIIWGIIALFIIGGPITNLAVAMAATRNLNETHSFKDIISLYNDKIKMHAIKELMLSESSGKNDVGWSEYYVDNALLDRFCNLRVQDATLYYAEKLGFDNPKMHDYMGNRISVLFPGFIAKMLNIEKKGDTTPADLMESEYLFSGNIRYAGNKVTGHLGAGLFWLGHLYFPVSFAIYFTLFYFFCTCVYTRQNYFIVPVFIICQIKSYLMFFVNSYGIISSIEIILRNGAQGIILYCLTMYIVRILIRY